MEQWASGDVYKRQIYVFFQTPSAAVTVYSCGVLKFRSVPLRGLIVAPGVNVNSGVSSETVSYTHLPKAGIKKLSLTKGEIYAGDAVKDLKESQSFTFRFETPVM